MKTKVFKKAAFAVVVAMLLTSNALHGQEMPSIKSHEVEPHFYIFNKPGYIVKSDNDIPLLVKDFIPICKEEFCLSECDDLRLKDYFMPSSSRVAKYQQYYKGYEVEDAIIIVESKEDTVTMITESLVGRLSLDTASPVSQSEALSIAIEALEAIHEVPGWLDSTFVNSYCRNCDGSFDSIRYKVIQPKGKLTVARKFGTEVAAENYRFVWSFHLGTAIKEFRVLVDANTGELFDVTDYTCYLGEFDDSAKVYTLYDSEHYMETYRHSTWQPWTLQNSKGNQTQLNGNPEIRADIYMSQFDADFTQEMYVMGPYTNDEYDQKALGDAIDFRGDNIYILGYMDTGDPMGGSDIEKIRNFYVALFDGNLNLKGEIYYHNDTRMLTPYSIYALPSGGCLVSTGGNDRHTFEQQHAIYKLSDETIVGIEEAHDAGFAVAVAYPNPGKDVLNIRTGLQDARVEVYDVNGRLVHRQDITENVTAINTTDWSEGAYVWKVYTGVSTGSTTLAETGKWIKE